MMNVIRVCHCTLLPWEEIIRLLSLKSLYLMTLATFLCHLESVWIELSLLKLKTENWKHYSKINFKCVNSTVGPICNEKIAEKWSLWDTWIVPWENWSKVAVWKKKKKKKMGKTRWRIKRRHGRLSKQIPSIALPNNMTDMFELRLGLPGLGIGSTVSEGFSFGFFFSGP